MSITRAARPESNFYILDKQVSEDGRLSWSARGMLVFLLGKPDHWQINIEALVNCTADSARPDKKTAVYAIIKELLSAGYMTKHKHGSGALDYVIYDAPQLQPIDCKPDSGNPNLDNPNLGFQPLVSNEGEVRIEKAENTAAKIFLNPPLWLDAKSWAEWIEHRKQIRKALTPLSVKKQLEQLEKWKEDGHDLTTVIDHCISKGYTGLFLPSNTTRKIAPASRHVVAFKSSGVGEDDIPF